MYDGFVLRRTITADWVEQVYEAIKAKGTSQRQLAIKIGVTPGAVNNILRRGGGASPIVELMSKELGIELPPLKALPPRVQRLADAAMGMNDAQLDALIALAEASKPK